MDGRCDFFLNFLLFQLNPLLSLQLSLPLTLKHSFSELSLPLVPGRIHEKSSPMKDIILPISLINGPIRKLVSPISMMLAVLPLSFVDRSVGIVIRSLSFHLVLLPLSLVELLSNDAG